MNLEDYSRLFCKIKDQIASEKEMGCFYVYNGYDRHMALCIFVSQYSEYFIRSEYEPDLRAYCMTYCHKSSIGKISESEFENTNQVTFTKESEGIDLSALKDAKKRVQNDIGYVYLAIYQDGSKVKIGRTQNLNQRKKAVVKNDTGMGNEWYYNLCIRHRDVEKFLHDRLSHLNIRGETFWFTDEVVTLYIEIMERYSLLRSEPDPVEVFVD